MVNWKKNAPVPAKPKFVLNKPLKSFSNNAARVQVSNKLNHRKPAHLPDIYFVRRSRSKLDEYFAQDEHQMKLSLRNQSPSIK